jgi:hypothetical protein
LYVKGFFNDFFICTQIIDFHIENRRSPFIDKDHKVFCVLRVRITFFILQTGSLLREQYNSLLEIISVLLTMEYEEKNEENVYTHHMKSIRAASEQLLCEVYVGIGTSGGLVPNRQIPGAVPLCTYKDRIERYERDYLLLHRIKLLAQMFQQQYV